ncbi:hypothetical protein [Millisia brevis]|uniref:hypothetical protein n=1 Tax=Millisia brevis TaxID=264148 RepID=UPI0012ECC9F4|nr:hypothetical protein [Millisia brevis]
MRRLAQLAVVTTLAAAVGAGLPAVAQAQPDLRPCSQHGPTTQLGCLAAHIAARAGSSDLEWYRFFLD